MAESSAEDLRCEVSSSPPPPAAVLGGSSRRSNVRDQRAGKALDSDNMCHTRDEALLTALRTALSASGCPLPGATTPTWPRWTAAWAGCWIRSTGPAWPTTLCWSSPPTSAVPLSSACSVCMCFSLLCPLHVGRGRCCGLFPRCSPCLSAPLPAIPASLPSLLLRNHRSITTRSDIMIRRIF